jgi:DNA-binding NarL/FixJ family response regulator
MGLNNCLNPMRRLNVLLADDHPIFAEGLQAVLSRPNGGKFAYQIQGVVCNGASKCCLPSKKYPTRPVYWS